MQSLRQKPFRLTLALAALTLAVLATVALALGAAPEPAAAATGSGPPPQSTPTPAPTPEPCSDNPAHVISSGHYALFDVYWDATDRNLVTNPCPPKITVTVHHETNDLGLPTGKTTYRHARSASEANIGTTVFHVPGAPNLTPRANNATDYEKWPFLYPDAADTDGDTDISDSEVGDPIAAGVWTLPDCTPGLPAPAPGDLCIGFSAQLLRTADWEDVNYRFETFRLPGIAADDRGHAYVFHRPGTTPEGDTVAIWTTADPDTNEIHVPVGEHLHPQWAFTKAGTYRFQVHAKASPIDATSLSLPAGTKGVTSLIRTYLIHVGDLSDLGVAIAASAAAPTVGTQVAYTLTASNAGPDAASDVTVTAAWPAGLTYHSSQTATGSYDSATGVWTVGSLAKDATATLSVTATTGPNTHGKPLAVTATIKATETIGASVVDELDPNPTDNKATATVTPLAEDNTAPIFRLTRAVAENSAGGTAVGDPIAVYEPDAGDTLTFGLTGVGAELFQAAANSDGNAQITVATGAVVNYEDAASYNLTLTVSDGKDGAGNADSAVDHRIGVLVNITDDANETLAVTLTADPTTQTVGGSVTLTARVTNSPVATSELEYVLEAQNVGGGSFIAKTLDRPTHAVTWNVAVSRQYHFQVAADSLPVTSNTVTVVWTGPPTN